MYVRLYGGKYFGMLTSTIITGDKITGKVSIEFMRLKVSLLESGSWSEPQNFNRFYPMSYTIMIKYIEDNFLADWNDSSNCLFNIVEPGAVFEKEYHGIHNDVWEG